MVIYTKNAEETKKIGEKIGSLLFSGSVVLLTGDLGAGKTTFTKGIGKALNVKKIINSPTFNIFKLYQGNLDLYHFDFYRLGENQYDFMLEEYLNNDGITVIEWPTCFMDIIPNEYLEIKIERIDDETRKLEINNKGLKYEKILGEINELNFR